MTRLNLRLDLSGEREGFALAGALLAMVVVGALITGSFFAASQENAIGLSSRYNDQATYTAEYALNQAIEQVPVSVLKNLANDTLLHYSASAADTLKYAVVNGDTIGRARVWVHAAGPNRLFVAQAVAVKGDRRYTGGTRVLGLMTHMKIASFSASQAMLVYGGLAAKGTSLISGRDTTPSGSGQSQWQQPGVCDTLASTKPAIVARDTSKVSKAGAAQIVGNPPKSPDATLDSADFKNYGDLDYSTLTSIATKTYTAATVPNAPTPTVDATTGLCDTNNTNNWGEPGLPSGTSIVQCENYFPVIHIKGDGNCGTTTKLNAQGRGQGILLVDDNLDISGGFEFWGITIVMCNLTSSGTGGHLNGTVMTLNNSSLDYDIAVGNSVVELSTCAVKRAAENIPGYNVGIPLRQHSFIDLTAAGAGF